jgi:hypothetical protein
LLVSGFAVTSSLLRGSGQLQLKKDFYEAAAFGEV